MWVKVLGCGGGEERYGKVCGEVSTILVGVGGVGVEVVRIREFGSGGWGQGVGVRGVESGELGSGS